MNKAASKHLWNKRAERGNYYRGETFYTITPLPFYVKRRQLLTRLMQSVIVPARRVLDFGCGDGWYMEYFNSLRKTKPPIAGLDISAEMVKQAKVRNPESRVYLSSTGVKKGERYDVIYSLATMAHVTGAELEKIGDNISQALTIKGKLLIFEQVAPFAYSGATFQRRTIEAYKNWGERHDFKVKKVYLLSFRAHRLFERYVAKYYQRLFKGEDYEKRLKANGQWPYRALSRLCLLFDTKPVKENVQSGWGNALIIFEKK